MKKWIKNKLLLFLGIETMEANLEKEIEKLKYQILEVENLNRRVISDAMRVIEENHALMKQFDLSVDVRPHENESWAVISIKGKPETVRFVNLSHRNMMEIHRFINQFSRTNTTIDSPFRMPKFRWER